MIKRLIKSISDERWNIGFIQNDFEGVLRGEQLQVKWLKHKCKKCWFADPFVLDVNDDEIHVLVEEYYKPIHRGRISRLIIDKKGFELKQKDVVLELPTHLSFPAILRKEGDIFVYPENGESGELILYHYFPNKNKCEKCKTIIDEAIADGVITKIGGTEMLFCTKQPNPNGNVIYIYCKGKSGHFIEKDKYVFDENIARMAGDFIEYDGRLYRPTQECNVQYGHAVTLQEVKLVGDHMYFDEIRRMYSTHPKLNVGMHTFNMYKGVIVTDALGFNNMWIRRILKVFNFI